jgi:hypothetical protein
MEGLQGVRSARGSQQGCEMMRLEKVRERTWDSAERRREVLEARQRCCKKHKRNGRETKARESTKGEAGDFRSGDGDCGSRPRLPFKRRRRRTDEGGALLLLNESETRGRKRNRTEIATVEKLVKRVSTRLRLLSPSPRLNHHRHRHRRRQRTTKEALSPLVFSPSFSSKAPPPPSPPAESNNDMSVSSVYGKGMPRSWEK